MQNSTFSMELSCYSLKSLNYIFIILVIINSFRLITGRRRCYSCSTLLESDDKYDCLYNIDNVTDAFRFMEYCPYYCTIRRQEYADVHGGISYLNRSCEDVKLDEVRINGFYVTYLRSCKSDLCNSGDGTTSLRDIPEDEDDEFEMGYPSKAISLSALLLPGTFVSWFFCTISYIFHSAK